MKRTCKLTIIVYRMRPVQWATAVARVWWQTVA